MDFLRSISDDLHALHHEVRKKYPVVKEAAEKALATLPQLQKQYASLLRDQISPGPGHPMFRCDIILRPFILTCNHTNVPPKIVILALLSIQRLVGWDAIQSTSIQSIMRVLQIQAEKNSHVDVHVKLLQTLLQLLTVGFEEKTTHQNCKVGSDTVRKSDKSVTQNISQDSNGLNSLIGNEDLVMQAICICLQLHGTSSGPNSVVGNTAAMTIRQIVSMTFTKVQERVAARRCGVLLFKELCLMSREENGTWLKCLEPAAVRAAYDSLSFSSLMSISLAVELLETVVASQSRLFRSDIDFRTVLKQQICPLLYHALKIGSSERGLAGVHASGSVSSSIGLTSNSTVNSILANSIGTSGSASHPSITSFPLLVRAMRLTSVILCSFSDILQEECSQIVGFLLQLVATGNLDLISERSFSNKSNDKKPHVAHGAAYLCGTSSTNTSSSLYSKSMSLSSANAHAHTTTQVGTSGAHPIHGSVSWSVLLALEVLNRLSLEYPMVACIVLADLAGDKNTIVHCSKIIASILQATSTSDFRVPRADSNADVAASATAIASGVSVSSSTVPVGTLSNIPTRCGLELLNDQETPTTPHISSAIRVAITCQSNLVSSIFELSRITQDSESSQKLATNCMRELVSSVFSALDCTMRHCHEMDLIVMSLKSYHLLATTASRLRANIADQASKPASLRYSQAVLHMEEVISASLHALCAFSFALPDRIVTGSTKGKLTVPGTSLVVAGNPMNVSGAASDYSEENTAKSLTNALDTAVEDDFCHVIVTWREIHAMKALFGAAHIMENELSETEWFILLEGLETIVGLTDPKAKNGQYKIAPKAYRIASFKAEDEDIEQQLLMLGTSIIEFLNNSVQLERSVHCRLVNALCKVCRSQLGFYANAQPPLPAVSDKIKLGRGSEITLARCTQHLKLYQNYLGIGLSGTGAYLPSFSLRTLVQLVPSHGKAYNTVVDELLLMISITAETSIATAYTAQIVQFQMFAAEQLLQLMQKALLYISHSDIEAAQSRTNCQEQIFRPLLALVIHSHVRDRALTALLELLNTCGHLVRSAWSLILQCIQESAESGDVKSQVLAFKCLRLIVDDLLAVIPRAYLPDCVQCIGRFAQCAKDVNISLTAVNELWSVADVIGRENTTYTEDRLKQWSCAFHELRRIALDERTEVRNCAINTLFGAGVTYGTKFSLPEWQFFLDKVIVPIAKQLVVIRRGPLTFDNAGENSGAAGSRPTHMKSTPIIMHHSRDSAEKQWDESQVLMFAGMSRVLRSNCHHLRQFECWFPDIWRKLLEHVMCIAKSDQVSKEVALAAINTLETLVQVASRKESSLMSQPVRAGAGMRVVGGTLISSNEVKQQSGGSNNDTVINEDKTADLVQMNKDIGKGLWLEGFNQLIGLCDERAKHQHYNSDDDSRCSWKCEEEQEIASAVVSALCRLYMQCKKDEFDSNEQTDQLLQFFESILHKHTFSAERKQHANSAIQSKNTTSSASSALQMRVLNAFMECGYFQDHASTHTTMVDHLVQYILMSASRDLVYFTRQALIALTQVYRSVNESTRSSRFLKVLGCISPFLRYEGDSAGIPRFAETLSAAAQKAAAQLWKYALGVLISLISHGLCAVNMEASCFQALVDTVGKFLDIPKSRLRRERQISHGSHGHVLPFARTEEDMQTALQPLVLLTEQMVLLLRKYNDQMQGSESIEAINTPAEDREPIYLSFVQLLVNGADIVYSASSTEDKNIRSSIAEDCLLRQTLLVKCCVRQLCALGLQTKEMILADSARAKLVAIASSALNDLHSAENLVDITSDQGSTAIAVRERALLFLTEMSEIGLHPQSVLELFFGLCQCIDSSDRRVRTCVQQILLKSDLPRYSLVNRDGLYH